MAGRTNHHKVAEHIRTRIKTGALQRGDRLPSFEQLHRQLGAAPATVSKALSSLAADGLVERRSRSGVYVAESIPKPRRLRIAVLAADPDQFASDYWTRLHVGMQSAAHSLGVEIAYLPPVDGIDWTEYGALLAYDVCPFDYPQGLPAVVIGSAAFRMPSVGINEYDAGYLATRHLIDLGHITIGFLGQLAVTATCLRLAGYHAALGKIWDEFTEKTKQYRDAIYRSGRIIAEGDDRLIRSMGFPIDAEPTYQNVGYGTMAEWLKDGFDVLECTAVVVQNDFAAEGVMACLRDHGYRVPDDVSVVGFDNERRCSEMTPPLTSVGGDMREVGARAVKTLVDAVQGLPVNNSMVEPHLFVRESTAPPANGKRPTVRIESD